MAAEGKLDLDPKHDHYDFPYISIVNKPGYAGHTTPQQDAQIFQFRTMLEQAGYTQRLDTLTLLRFLRARKFDVEKSKQMFVDSEKWRKSFGGVGLDTLVPVFEYTEKEEIFKFYPQYYHNTDKDGRPVYIEHLGKINLTEMKRITTDERMLQNLSVEYEKLADPRLPACSRKAGHLLETCCTIMDAKGVSLTSAPSVYGYLAQASSISQNYYPERLGKLYIVNAPWGFSTVFSVIKSFLDPVTVAKIHVLGSNYQKELLTQIPAEHLPAVLGGECRCEGGCMFSDVGPWQDPKYTNVPAWSKDAKADNAVPPVQSSSGVEESTQTEGDAAAKQPAKATKDIKTTAAA